MSDETNINEGKVILSFVADWCGPCKMMAPVLEQFAGDYKVVKLDVDENPEAVLEYKVRGVPSFVLLNDGEIVGLNIGAMSKSQFESFVLLGFS